MISFQKGNATLTTTFLERFGRRARVWSGLFLAGHSHFSIDALAESALSVPALYSGTNEGLLVCTEVYAQHNTVWYDRDYVLFASEMRHCLVRVLVGWQSAALSSANESIRCIWFMASHPDHSPLLYLHPAERQALFVNFLSSTFSRFWHTISREQANLPLFRLFSFLFPLFFLPAFLSCFRCLFLSCLCCFFCCRFSFFSRFVLPCFPSLFFLLHFLVTVHVAAQSSGFPDFRTIVILKVFVSSLHSPRAIRLLFP